MKKPFFRFDILALCLLLLFSAAASVLSAKLKNRYASVFNTSSPAPFGGSLFSIVERWGG